MNLLADLDRHISRALERGKGVRLEADQLDLLVATGAYAVFHAAAEEELRLRAIERMKERGDRFGATAPPVRPHETAAEASMRRVQEILTEGRRYNNARRLGPDE